jgi:DNA-binding transcriptional LysR family regulator
MRPTTAGTSLAERARRALTELDRARAELAPTSGTVTGLVNVGLLESTADLLAAPLVTAVLRHHPGIELRVMTAYSGYLQQWLDDGDLDLSLVYNLTSTPSVSVRTLVTEKLWVVAPADAGLSPMMPVPLAAAAEHPLVMPAPGHALRVLIDRAAVQTGVVIDIAVQTNSMSLQKQLVQGGHGWTILPGAGIATDVTLRLFSVAPLTEPEVHRSIAIGISRSGPITPASRLVAEELVRQVQAAATSSKWPSAQICGK